MSSKRKAKKLRFIERYKTINLLMHALYALSFSGMDSVRVVPRSIFASADLFIVGVST